MSTPAQVAPQVADAYQRRRALDPAESFIVQAPAGSGKTELLVQRYLALVEQVRAPESILAITFTRKAAGEMRARVLEAAPALRDNPARLRIQTIDSLAASIVQRMPFLARLGAVLPIVEDASELYAEAARLTLTDLSNPAVSRLALHLDNSFQRAQRMIEALVARRDQWLRHVGIQTDPQAPRAQIEAELDRVVQHGLRAARAAVPEWARREIDGIGLRQAVDLLLTKGGEWRSRIPPKLARLGGDDRLQEALLEVRRLPEPRFNERQWTMLADLVALLPVAVANLKLVFREREQTDFVEQAEAARRALGDPDHPEDLALYFGERFEHILVDEFQDTSMTQLELLERLIAAWEPGDGRTLFLVGDPMQSIYRFREADVGLFLRIRERGVRGVRPEALTLTTNFRSQPGIIDWINQAFSRIFPGCEDIATGAVRYTPSTAHREASATEAVVVHPLFTPDGAIEAKLVADLIHQSRGTIAVLVRARSHAPAIAGELRRRGVRFRAVDLDPLATRPVIRDLAALTRALLDPADRTAWLAILRAPWCGMTLAELESGAVPSVFERTIDEARKKVHRVPLRRLVEQTWRAIGGPGCVPDPAALSDAERFLELVDEIDDVTQLDRRLAKLFAQPDPEADGRIQIMTIHKAKGLEFDTVIVPGLGRDAGREQRPLLRWAEVAVEDGTALVVAPIEATEDEGDPIYDYLAHFDRTRTRNELARVLYVAATRARERLHLVGHVLKRPHAGSLLELLWPVVEPEFARARPSESPLRPRPKPAQTVRRMC